MNNNFLLNIVENNLTFYLIIIIIAIAAIVFLFLSIGIKIFSKKVRLKTFDNYLEINETEKIIYNNIIKLDLKTIRAKGRYIMQELITGYILKLKYNENKNINFVVFTGSSKNEKENCKSLLDCYAKGTYPALQGVIKGMDTETYTLPKQHTSSLQGEVVDFYKEAKLKINKKL